MKVAKYISEFFVKQGVTDMFMITGGAAMHLNDAFGHQEGLKITYNHHEQACTIAAELMQLQVYSVHMLILFQCLLLLDRLKERQQYGQLTFRFVSLVIRKLILHQQYLL